jgi:hypothetical protein
MIALGAFVFFNGGLGAGERHSLPCYASINRATRNSVEFFRVLLDQPKTVGAFVCRTGREASDT